MKSVKLPSLNGTIFIVVISVFVLMLSAHAADIASIEKDISRGCDLLRTKAHQEAILILENAITELKKLQAEQPQNVFLTFLLGKALFYLEKDAEATAAFSMVKERDKEDPRPHFYLALIAKYGGKLEEAEEEFKIVCRLVPDDDRNWYELGKILSQKGQDQEAITAYQKSVSLNPNNSQASYDLAISHIAVGQRDAAYPLLNTLMKEQPFNIIVAYNFGQLCQDLCKYEEALDSFLQVIDKDPSEWRARAKLIQMYQATNLLKKRDEQRKELYKLRSIGNIKPLLEEQKYCREQFSVAGENLMVMEYFDLTGDWAVRYSFLVLDETKQKSKYRISLGSYDNTNKSLHEIGDLEVGQHLFHLDGYYSDDLHKTFMFFEEEPKYDDVRAIVIDILNGKLQEISSSAHNKSGEFEIVIKPPIGSVLAN